MSPTGRPEGEYGPQRDSAEGSPVSPADGRDGGAAGGERGQGPVNADFVLCGVGGQGVLSIAWIIDEAAVTAGYQLKQPEVHGMAQRGGAVSAFVRIADRPIASDLIGAGEAHAIVAVEPLEALRYVHLLRPDGWIVTDVTPFVNVSNYPATDALYDVLFATPRLIALDATRLAHAAGTAKAQNMVVLGAAAALLPMPAPLLERFIEAQFAAKGARIVAANIAAFRMGAAAGAFTADLLDRGVPGATAARAAARLAFAPERVAGGDVDRWAARLLAADGAAFARTLFDSAEPTALAGLAATQPA
jgi:indolepyruvate ferredoxin oxidoreductase beta subunit